MSKQVTLTINGKEVTTPLRSANKFFGSVIENTNGVSFPRNPSGTNTLGYDTGFLEILNAEPEYIKNNETKYRLSEQDGHPSAIGHEKIAEIYYEKLLDNGYI